MEVTANEAAVLLYVIASVPTLETLSESYGILEAQISLEDLAAKAQGTCDVLLPTTLVDSMCSFFDEHEKLPLADTASVESLRKKLLPA